MISKEPLLPGEHYWVWEDDDASMHCCLCFLEREWSVEESEQGECPAHSVTPLLVPVRILD